MFSKQIVDSTSLSKLYSKPAFYDAARHRPIIISHLLPHLEHVARSIVLSSILWVTLRTIPEPEHQDEHDEVFQATFMKEFSAATRIVFSAYQELPYHYFGQTGISIPPHLRPPWAQRALDMVPNIIHRMARHRTLVPRVNRTKNVSRPTAYEYSLYRKVADLSEVRTVDLEVLYGETGIRIGGACEMRQSWKFNELKPRLYYCKGGLAHHASKYVKDITVAIMDSLDITCTDNRRRPWEFLECEEYDHIVYWDLTAFTSTLSELKYFLYYLSCAIEDYGERPLFAVDYHLGLIELSISEVLREYSEVVNILHPITISRLLNRFIGEEFEDQEYEMVNSGPLGVDGNIGLSTACHGYAMLLESEGPGKDVNVGDDGLSLCSEHPSISLYPRLRTIGNLHPEKEGIIPAFDWKTTGKFLKRRLERVDGGIFIGSLLSFPLPNLLDGEYGFRTASPDSDHKRIMKIIKTVGALVWSITGDCHNLSDRDYHLVSVYLREVYHRLGADPRGNLEGFLPKQSALHSNIPCSFIHVSYPPVVFDTDFDPRDGDWLLYLLHRDAAMASVRVDVLTSPGLIEKPDLDDIVHCSRSPLYNVLEDMGYVVMEDVVEHLDLQTEDNRVKFLRHISSRKGDLVPLVSMTVKSSIPVKFDFMFATPDIVAVNGTEMY